MLINVKMPTIVGILTFMSRINFMLSWNEHEKSFITSEPGDMFSHMRPLSCNVQDHENLIRLYTYTADLGLNFTC